MRTMRLAGLGLAVALMVTASVAEARPPEPQERSLGDTMTMVLELRAAPAFPTHSYVDSLEISDSVAPASIGTMEEMVSVATAAESSRVLERSSVFAKSHATHALNYSNRIHRLPRSAVANRTRPSTSMRLNPLDLTGRATPHRPPSRQ